MYCIQYVLLVEDMVGVTVTMSFCDLSLHIWSPEPPRNLSLVWSRKNIAGTRIDKKREIFSRPRLLVPRIWTMSGHFMTLYVFSLIYPCRHYQVFAKPHYLHVSLWGMGILTCLTYVGCKTHNLDLPDSIWHLCSSIRCNILSTWPTNWT